MISAHRDASELPGVQGNELIRAIEKIHASARRVAAVVDHEMGVTQYLTCACEHETLWVTSEQRLECMEAWTSAHVVTPQDLRNGVQTREGVKRIVVEVAALWRRPHLWETLVAPSQGLEVILLYRDSSAFETVH